MNNETLVARRRFLRRSTSMLFGSITLSHNLSALATDQRKNSPVPAPSKDTAVKFSATGEPKPFLGNTVICHLPQQCAFRDATESFGRALHGTSFSHKLATLPQESYHLTVFAGMTDSGRSDSSWPSDLPLDAPIGHSNAVIRERMEMFRLQCEFPLRMKLDEEATIHYRGAITLRMVPVDDQENLKIRHLRDRLSDVYRFRAKDHDRYEFHIGLAYRLMTFTRDEEEEYNALVALHATAIASSAHYLELGLPAFCTFRSMYRFDIEKILNT